MRSHPVDVAVVALALGVFGLVALALVWSGEWAYAGLADTNGVDGANFARVGHQSLNELISYHRAWSTYVIGISESPPTQFVPAVFTVDELSHMDDVRNVFRGAETAAGVALVVVLFRAVRAARSGRSVRLVRDASLVAVGSVAVIGVAAAFAFDSLFLLFHEIFFPQGNFLFDPATSNLLRLYPDWYWQGITAGVAISFIAAALLVAVAAHLALRPRSNTYTRAR